MDVGFGESLDFLGHGVSLVKAWPYPLCLDEGVYLAATEGAISVDGDFHYGRVAGDAGEVHAVGGAEIAEAVGDEAAFIDFHSADYVGTVAIDYVGTIVNAEVGEVAQVTAVFAKECLLSVGQAVVGFALGTTMERDDDYVGLLTQVGDNSFHQIEVGVLERVGVVAKGADAVFHSVNLNQCALLVAGNTAEGYALFCQHALGGGYAFVAKVAGMIVGHAKKIVASILEQWRKMGGHAEGVAVGAVALGALSTVADGAFQVAYGDGGLTGDCFGVTEDVASVVGRQLHGREGGAHHDVSGHCDGEGVGVTFGSTCVDGGGHKQTE